MRKYTRYTLKTKIKAIVMKQNQIPCHQIIKILNIKNIAQVYGWSKRYHSDPEGNLDNL